MHATELKSPRPARYSKAGKKTKPASKWLAVNGQTRQQILGAVYNAITSFTPSNPDFPLRIFGAVVDRAHKQFATAEQIAYDHVLHRFDEMLRSLPSQTATSDDSAPSTATAALGPAGSSGSGRIAGPGGSGPSGGQRGLVIHDRRDGHDRNIQKMAELWQRTGSRLDSLVQVPLFTDSRASRLVQAADFVAYALYRQYQPTSDDRHSRLLWPHVHEGANNEMSGVIHLHPGFRRKQCQCPPCASRY